MYEQIVASNAQLQVVQSTVLGLGAVLFRRHCGHGWHVSCDVGPDTPANQRSHSSTDAVPHTSTDAIANAIADACADASAHTVARR